MNRCNVCLRPLINGETETCEADACYFYEADKKNRTAVRVARFRGQSLNKLIRKYNEDPTAFARFMGEPGVDRFYGT
jgi:hypothetical protein